MPFPAAVEARMRHAGKERAPWGVLLVAKIQTFRLSAPVASNCRSKFFRGIPEAKVYDLSALPLRQAANVLARVGASEIESSPRLRKPEAVETEVPITAPCLRTSILVPTLSSAVDLRHHHGLPDLWRSARQVEKILRTGPLDRLAVLGSGLR